MAHVVVLGLVLTLVAGVVSFAVLARKLRAGPSRLPRSIPTPLLLYNLWIAAWLVQQYLAFNLYPSLPRPVAGVTAAAFGLLLSLLALAWLAAHAALADQFVGSTASNRTRLIAVRGSLALAALLAAAWVLGFVLPAARPFYGVAARIAMTLLFPAALAIGAGLAIGARREPEAGARRALHVLGYSYVVLFALLTVLIIVGPWVLPAPVLLSADLALELAYNVLTVAWVLRYADAFAAPARPLFEAGRGFDALCEAFKISKREREIVELICLGLTNQQIAERLFISLGTVKDHNYTIFQKAGVKNRTQLAQLFSQAPGPAAAAPTATAGDGDACNQATAARSHCGSGVEK